MDSETLKQLVKDGIIGNAENKKAFHRAAWAILEGFAKRLDWWEREISTHTDAACSPGRTILTTRYAVIEVTASCWTPTVTVVDLRDLEGQPPAFTMPAVFLDSPDAFMRQVWQKRNAQAIEAVAQQMAA